MPYTSLTMHMTNDIKERDSVTFYSESSGLLIGKDLEGGLSGCPGFSVQLEFTYIHIAS